MAKNNNINKAKIFNSQTNAYEKKHRTRFLHCFHQNSKYNNKKKKLGAS